MWFVYGCVFVCECFLVCSMCLFVLFVMYCVVLYGLSFCVLSVFVCSFLLIMFVRFACDV